MAKYSIDGSTLTDIADAIRTQYGEDSPIAVTDMAEAILGIEGGGGDIPFKMTSGEFSLMANQSTVTVDYGGENYPLFFMIFCDDMMYPQDHGIGVYTQLGGNVWLSRAGTSAYHMMFFTNYQGNITVQNNQNVFQGIDETGITFKSYSGNYFYRPTVHYKWLAIFND